MKKKSLSEIRNQASVEKLRIIQIAFEQLQKTGDLQIRNLADLANVHIPVIYKIFGGKSGLIFEVRSYMLEVLLEKLQAGVQDYTHPFLKLTQYGVNYINTAINDSNLFKLIFNEHFDIDITSEQRGDIQSIANNAIVASIRLLTSIVTQVYNMNISSLPYSEKRKEDDIEQLVVRSWASVHGISTIAYNYHNLKKLCFSNLQESLLEALVHTNLMSSDFLEQEMELGMQAVEIIRTINLV